MGSEASRRVTALGPFDLVREIGRGAMGAVHEAIDRRSGERVALKVLWPFLGAEEATRERFRREIRVLSRLSDPHIVAARGGLLEEEGTLLFAMELVEGRDLAEILRVRGPLAIERAVEVARQVLEGLAAAHAQGVVHRDLKPSNILLEPDGEGVRVRLADFGIAQVGDITHLTRTGQVVGSAPYMSPEQCRGEEATGATDLYAAGAILYEMLEGRAPYTGATSMVVIRSHLESPLPRLSDAAGPRGVLEAVVRRAMAKDPSQRYADAGAMARALAAVIDLPSPRGWADLWQGDTTVAPGGEPTRVVPGAPVEGTGTGYALAGENRPWGASEGALARCLACGGIGPEEVERCAECGERMAWSLFPHRCIPWETFDRVLTTLAYLAGGAAILLPSRESFLVICLATGALGWAYLQAREAYGWEVLRPLRRQVVAHLQETGDLSAAFGSAALALLCKPLAGAVGSLAVAPWLLAPAWGVWLHRHRKGAARREEVLRRRREQRSLHWEVLGEERRRWALEDLSERIAAGTLRPDASLRGPGTGLLWRPLSRVSDLASALGRCHVCAQEVGPGASNCLSCGSPLYDTASIGLGLPPLILRSRPLSMLKSLIPPVFVSFAIYAAWELEWGWAARQAASGGARLAGLLRGPVGIGAAVVLLLALWLFERRR